MYKTLNEVEEKFKSNPMFTGKMYKKYVHYRGDVHVALVSELNDNEADRYYCCTSKLYTAIPLYFGGFILLFKNSQYLHDQILDEVRKLNIQPIDYYI